MNINKISGQLAAAAVAVSLAGTPAIAVPTAQEDLNTAATYGGAAAGLSCAAGVAWSGFFTWGIAPAIVGLLCSLGANHLIKSID